MVQLSRVEISRVAITHIQVPSCPKQLDPVWSPLALAADALKGPVGFRSW